MNQLAEVLRSQEERDRLRNIEQLRRKGERFIKVRYVGSTVPLFDSEGLCYNVRLHGLRDIEAYEQGDINTGKTEWKARHGARVLYFRQSIGGDTEADIWDDPDGWNRKYISTHPELEVVDGKLAEEIKAEKNKPFKAELSRKEQLEREVAERLRELDSINEADGESKKNPVGRPKKDGIDKSTSGMDSSGVSRVAT